MGLKVKPPVISEQTKKEMAQFFAKHSTYKILAEQRKKERQARDKIG